MLDTMKTKWRLKRLIRSWIAYRNAVLAAFDVPEPAPSDEARFLTLKARIASQLNFLAEAVPVTTDGDPRRVVAEMTHQLQHHRQLRVLEPGGLLTREEFDRRWHEHYIFLNKLRGMSLRKLDRKRRTGGVPTGMRRNFIPRRFPVRRTILLLDNIAIFALLVYVIGSALGVGRNATGRFSVTLPTSVGGAVENVLNGLEALWMAIVPALAAYGPVALVIVAVLILAGIGYRAMTRV